MSRVGWQVIRKISVVVTALLVLGWLVLIGGVIFFALTADRGTVVRFLLVRSTSDDGPPSYWTPMHFVLEKILIALFTLGAWLLSQHAQRHLRSSTQNPAESPTET
jgi:hypothetical protein